MEILKGRELEDFTPHMLEEWERKVYTLQDSIKSVDSRIEDMMGRIVEAKKNIDNVEKINKEVSRLREQRRQAIAEGLDHSEISEGISAALADYRMAQEELELARDEEIAFESVEHNLRNERRGYENVLASVLKEIDVIKLCLVAKEYNSRAKALAETVKAYREMTDGINDSEFNNLPRWAKHMMTRGNKTALSCIPILRLHWKRNELYPMNPDVCDREAPAYYYEHPTNAYS